MGTLGTASLPTGDYFFLELFTLFKLHVAGFAVIRSRS
jgi:hypothetical protein